MTFDRHPHHGDTHVDPEAHDHHTSHRAHENHGDHAGHAGHADQPGHAGHGDHVAQFRRLFWIMLALAVPVVGLSTMFAHLVGYHLPDTGWIPWVSPVLGTVSARITWARGRPSRSS